MFELRKRKLSVTDLAAEAEEAVRMALDVHFSYSGHQSHIRLGQREIDPGKKRNEADDFRFVTVNTVCKTTGLTYEKVRRVYAEVEMKKKNGCWMPNRIPSILIEDEGWRGWYTARWEERENVTWVLLIAPIIDNYHLIHPYFRVGDYHGNRWIQPFYPKQ